MPSDLASFAQFAMEQQTSKDEARDAVLGQLSRAVLENYTAFIGGMKHIGEVDMDVARAMIHVSNALRQLRAARSTLTMQSLQVTAKHRRLLRLRAVASRLQWLASARSAAGAVSAAVAQGRFLDAATVAASTASKLGGGTAATYVSLQGEVARAAQALPRLAASMDGALHKLAQQWVAADPTPATTQLLPRVHAWLSHVAAECSSSTLLQDAEGAPDAQLPQAQGFWEALPPLLRLPRVVPSLLRAYARLDEAGVPVTHADGSAAQDSHLAALPDKLLGAVVASMKHATKAALVDIVLRCSGARRVAVAAVRAVQLAGDALKPSAAAVARQQTAAAARARSASTAGGRPRTGTASEGDAGATQDAGDGLEGAAAALARAAAAARAAYQAEHARLWDGRFADVCRELGEVVARKNAGGQQQMRPSSDDAEQAAGSSSSDGVWRGHLAAVRAAVKAAGVSPLDTGADSDPLGAPHGDWLFEGEHAVSGSFLLPHITARLGAAVASTAHWHLLLVRLMQCFGDERCSDWAFLHSDEAAAAPEDSDEADFAQRVAALGAQLLQGAPSVWEQAQDRVGSALAAVAAAAGEALPASGLQAALAAALDIQRVGVQYVSAAAAEAPMTALREDRVPMAALVQGAAPLRASLRLVCASLLDAQHASSMQRLRGLLAKELWTPVPLPPDALAGVLSRVTHSHPLWWQWTPQWAAAAPYAASADGSTAWLSAAHSTGRPSASSPGVGRVWEGLHACPPWLQSPQESIQHNGTALQVTNSNASLSTAASRVLGFGFAPRVWVGSAAGGAAEVALAAPWRRALPSAGSLLSSADSEARLSHPCIAAAVAAVTDVGDGVLLGAAAEGALGRLLGLRMELPQHAEGHEALAPAGAQDGSADDGVCVLLARAEVLGYGVQWRGGVHWWQVYAAAAAPSGSTCPALSGGNPFGRVCDGPLPDGAQWHASLLAARGVVEAAEHLSHVAASVTVTAAGSATPAAALAATALSVIPRLTWQRDDVYVLGVPLLPVAPGDSCAPVAAGSDDEDEGRTGEAEAGGSEQGAVSVMMQAVAELRRGAADSAGVVCTSAGVNGLLPAVARYVRLLQCCPGLAVETWEALSGAMDLFLHCSTSCALPLPALRAVVAGQGERMAAVAAHVRAAKGSPLTAEDIPLSVVSSDGGRFPYLDSNAVPPAVLTGVAAMGALHTAGSSTGGAAGALLGNVAAAASAIVQAAKRDPWPLPFLTLRSVLLHSGARLRHTALFEGHTGAASTGGSTAGGRSKDGSSDRVSAAGLARVAQRRLGLEGSGPGTPAKAARAPTGSAFHSPSVHSGAGGTGGAADARSSASGSGGDGSWLNFHAPGAGVPAPLVPPCEAAELGGEMETLEWGSAPLPSTADALPPHDMTGLPARAVAAEATQQLLLALAAAAPWLQGSLPAAGQSTLRAWVSTLSTAVLQLRAACANALVARLAPELGGAPAALGRIPWDKVHDVTAGDGAEYVAGAGAVLQRAGAALEQARVQGTLPPVAHLGVWLGASGRLFSGVALGVARVPKATLEGRGVMAMHANTLGVLLSRHGPSLGALLAVAPPPGRHSGVAAVAGHGRPLADKAWLDAFIKAYYFGDASEDALAWLKASACVSGAKGREGTLVPLAPWGVLLPHLLASPADSKGQQRAVAAAAAAVGTPPALGIVAGSRGASARGSGAGVYRAPYPLEVGRGLLEQGASGGGMLGRGGERSKAGKAGVQSLVQWHAAAAALDITALLGIEAEAGGAFLGADGEQ